MKDLRDSYMWEENRKILTENETHIAGLRMFGHDNRKISKGSNEIHYHSESIEITYVVKGLRLFSVGEVEDHYASGGEAYITFLNEPHSVGNKSQGFGEFYWIQLEFLNETGFLGLSAPWDAIMFRRLKEINKRKIKLDKSFSKFMEDALSKFISKNESERSEAHILLLMFLKGILDGSKQDVSGVPDDINKARKYIRKNLYNTIQFEKLAEISGLSVSGFKHKFAVQVGMTPMQYVNFLKIEEAKRLIEGEEKMLDISERLGFASNSHFASVFKKMMSISPSEYKNRVERRKSENN